MLFPLSKSFSSTRIFQTGGDHNEQPKFRKSPTDPEGLEDKVQDLHMLIFKNKPYDKHISLAKKYAEPRRLRDLAHSKSHSALLQKVSNNLDDRMERNIKEMRQNAREYEKLRKENDDGLRQEMLNQAKEYRTWRETMEGRVKELPPIYGDPPQRESTEGMRQRERDRRKQAARREKDYFKEQAELQDRLQEEMDKRKVFAGGGRRNDFERKEASNQMSRQLRDWEATLEAIYDGHSHRISKNLENMRQEHRERDKDDRENFERTMDTLGLTTKKKETLLANQIASDGSFRRGNSAAIAAKMARLAKESKKEIETRNSRIAARPKSFAGYQPVVKSDRRRRDELVDSEVTALKIDASGRALLISQACGIAQCRTSLRQHGRCQLRTVVRCWANARSIRELLNPEGIWADV